MLLELHHSYIVSTSFDKECDRLNMFGGKSMPVIPFPCPIDTVAYFRIYGSCVVQVIRVQLGI
jgi:hypothetical protein